MDDVRIDALAESVQRLHQSNLAMARECRRWRIGAVGVLLGALVLGVAGAASSLDQAPRKLEAQNFVLRDPEGRIRASLGFRADGTPGFALMDERSRVRLALDLCDDGCRR